MWAVTAIDQILELLSGVPAGERAPSGYPHGTINRLVEERLRTFAEASRAQLVGQTW